MKQGEGKNFLSSVCLLSLAVVALMLCLSAVPSVTFGGVTTKEIDILGDIAVKETVPVQEDEIAEPENDDPKRMISLSDPSLLTIDNPASSPELTWETELYKEDSTTMPAFGTDSLYRTLRPGDVEPIEDFSEDGRVLYNFLNSLANIDKLKRPVRVGVLGDSFIEGDILTADLRESLQAIFGGGGVGFVPVTSPVSNFRKTVKHTFSDNWTTCSILKRSRNSAEVNASLPMAGFVYVPGEGATVEYKGVAAKNLDRFSLVRILFVNRGQTNISITLNDGQEKSFVPGSDGKIQQLIVRGDITRIKARFTNVEGFTLYGMFLEERRGVEVDNFSVRAHSGTMLAYSNQEVNSQINAMTNYDLIVLQFGLNTAEANTLSYTAYKNSMVAVVNHLKESFPKASFLLMSVGDRCMNQGGNYVTMPGIKAMVAAQREIARESGIAYWNTFRAMGGDNAMCTFVAKGWGGKDYTHINYNGGRFIAGELTKAIMLEKLRFDDNTLSARYPMAVPRDGQETSGQP